MVKSTPAVPNLFNLLPQNNNDLEILCQTKCRSYHVSHLSVVLQHLIKKKEKKNVSPYSTEDAPEIQTLRSCC